MKPFLAFLALEASSMRLRTSARLRSISACFAFFACVYQGRKEIELVSQTKIKRDSTVALGDSVRRFTSSMRVFWK